MESGPALGYRALQQLLQESTIMPLGCRDMHQGLGLLLLEHGGALLHCSEVLQHHSHKPGVSDCSVCAPVVGFDDVVPVRWSSCQSAQRE